MFEPEISVIVTTYNREQFLKKTVDCILSQSFQNFELIIVDNNSNYDFWGLINSYSDYRIKAYQNDNGGVISVNRNYGIRKANGKVLAFCDDDDCWRPDKLERCICCFPQYDIVYHKMMTTQGYPLRIKKLDSDPFDVLIKGNCIAFSSVCIKKTVFDTVGYFNQLKDFVAVEDWDFWLRASLNGIKFHCIPEILGDYYLASSTTSCSSKQVDRMKIIYNEYERRLTEVQRYKLMGYIDYMAARVHHILGDFRTANTYYMCYLKNIHNIEYKINTILGLCMSCLHIKR